MNDRTPPAETSLPSAYGSLVPSVSNRRDRRAEIMQFGSWIAFEEFRREIDNGADPERALEAALHRVTADAQAMIRSAESSLALAVELAEEVDR